MTPAIRLALIAALTIAVVSCGGGSNLDDTEAPVVLTIEITQYTPDIDICLSEGIDVIVSQMSINSNPKNPGGVLGPNADVLLRRWVVTPARTDGGTVASPQWVYDQTVLVEAGGTADLQNYRVFPSEYFNLEPLVNLRPENGGFDPETGQSNIRQSLRLQIFGETVAGKKVSTVEVPIAFNFTCLN
jgi:hypothetical protein